MDADAPLRSAFGGSPGIAFVRQPLQPQGEFDSADDRAKLDQDPVADRLDYARAVLSDDWISSGAMLAQGLPCARFVEPHLAGCSRRCQRQGSRRGGAS